MVYSSFKEIWIRECMQQWLYYIIVCLFSWSHNILKKQLENHFKEVKCLLVEINDTWEMDSWLLGRNVLRSKFRTWIPNSFMSLSDSVILRVLISKRGRCPLSHWSNIHKFSSLSHTTHTTTGVCACIHTDTH